MRPLALSQRLKAFVERLGTRRAERVTVAVATLLALPSVGPHRVLDDYVLALIAQGRGEAVGLGRRVLDCFTFTTGNAEDNHRLMDVGLMLPWWTDEHLHIAFFRPLSSLTHWLDERLFPGSPALMHVHSLLWFAALLAAAAVVYRRLEPSPTLAGLGFWLYAVDDAHGPVVAWLANRNALIATALGCVSLAAHDAWRQSGRRGAAWVAAGAFAVGLLAGESAIGVLAYLASYALVLERGTPTRRALTLAPYGLVLAVWRAAWGRAGYGAHGSGAYIDPIASPAEFVSALPARLAVLFNGQFGAPAADVATLSPPSHQPLIVAVALATVALMGWLLAPIVRADERARFWALGALLALLPLAATFPSDRMLLFVGLGGMALLARLFSQWIEAAASGTLPRSFRSIATFGYAVLHLAIAPVLLPFRAAQMELFGIAHDAGAQGIASDDSVTDQTVVVVAAPMVLFANYVQAERELLGVPRPRHLYLLSAASSPLDVERTGPSTLTITPARGFVYTPIERHYRGDVASLVGGPPIRLSSMTVVPEGRGEDGRPLRARFTFTRPAREYRFVTWRGDRFVPFELPRLGDKATLPEQDYGAVVARAALRALFSAGGSPKP